MPRIPVIVLSVALAAVLHVDWHLARPANHRLSLEWPLHWALTAMVFAAAGAWIGRYLTEFRWRVAFAIFLAAVLLAQGIEPAVEVMIHEGRLGYPDEPLRWAAFGRAIAAATPAYFAAVWICGRRRPARGGRA